MSFMKENISQLNYDEVRKIHEKQASEPILIDVREHEEYVNGHIPGIPLIPMSEIVDVIDDFNKEKEYVLVCRSGRRSHEVAKFFKDNGIENVHNYADGMLGWDTAKNEGEEWIVKDIEELYK
ncbi:rhodanese-like domain-containing protein [Bacillus shivajii]|uniref:rhodanese-like domain-containing protein n=1 Tax=Bacillus shivajii TaxID=1983719 RepID=UPI001CF97580|nr:rhodanese-like domain-containing protein [Bacillus shivajii]UCZ52451.1 rhodanese-like domain-containing protein [Bacillus shivajii]